MDSGKPVEAGGTSCATRCARAMQAASSPSRQISGGCATLGLALQSRLACLSFDMTHRWQLDQAEEAHVLFDQRALGKDVITPLLVAAWCQGATRFFIA